MSDEDPFALDDDVEEADENQVDDGNKSFADLRKAYKRSERQLKANEKELEDLRVFKQTVVTEQRKGAIETTFKEVGLSPKHALLFEKVSPDVEVTPEVVQASDDSGSTAYIVREVEKAPGGARFAIGTEWHLVNRLANDNPGKTVVPLRRSACATMARTDIFNVCYVLENLAAGKPVKIVTVAPEIARQARSALQRMLEIK